MESSLGESLFKGCDDLMAIEVEGGGEGITK